MITCLGDGRVHCFRGPHLIADHRTVWSFGDRGHLLRKATDDNGDGVADHAHTYTYDARGRPLVTELAGVGGHLHRRTTWSYDERRRTIERDDGADGTIDTRWIRTFDVDDQPLSVEKDSGADGTIEEDLRLPVKGRKVLTVAAVVLAASGLHGVVERQIVVSLLHDAPIRDS